MARDWSRVQSLLYGACFMAALPLFPMGVKTMEIEGKVIECPYEGVCKVLIDGVVHEMQGSPLAMNTPVLVTVKEELPISFSPLPSVPVFHERSGRCLDKESLSMGIQEEVPCGEGMEKVILHGDRKLPGT